LGQEVPGKESQSSLEDMVKSVLARGYENNPGGVPVMLRNGQEDPMETERRMRIGHWGERSPERKVSPR